MKKDLEYYINQDKDKCSIFGGEIWFPPPKMEDKNKLLKDILVLAEKLKILKTIIDNKTIESGSLPWDINPTKGHTEYILSSDSLYNYFQLYYNKEQIDELIQNLWIQVILYSKEKQPIDSVLSEFSENPVQNKVITRALKEGSVYTFKTINGESITGTGNIEIGIPQLPENLVTLDDISGFLTLESLLGYLLEEDLSEYVKLSDLELYLTTEDLFNYMNPLKVTASISPSLSKYTGEPVNITILILAKKGNNIVNPDKIIITCPNSEPLEINTTTFNTEISYKGTSRFNISCEYNGESDSTSVNTAQVLPTYIGFDLSQYAEEIDLNNFLEKILSGILRTENLENTIPGRYLWIITPYTLNTVATDSGYTFTVSMEPPTVINGLNYYRSSAQLDITSTITYYIK